ncbi:MAG: phosphotransferase family protein [Acidobacteriota bacterium]|nr:MAG: phosphotransferase family protein [Acidobacteriota bacterium]
MRETSTVRTGEELDEVRLTEYLRAELRIPVEELVIRQFPAGSSNLTYSVTADGREFVLRRPPFGNRVKTAHDMSREYKALSKLSPVYHRAPKPLLFCEDESVMGCHFYLMERKQGLILRGEVPEKLKESEDLRRDVCRSFVRNLADLHSIDHASIGLEDFGKPDGYVQRQVVGWSQRYFNAKTDEWDELEKAIFWMNNNVPEDDGAALIHNDYKFDNLILDPEDVTEIVGVLDWEMATVGSPLMDLGTTLGYWMSPAEGDEMLSMPFNPRLLMETVSRREIAEMYSEFSGRDTSNIAFYYVFGTIKIAVIAQQIYFRYKKGFTADRRFERFDRFVEKLGKIASRAIREGGI